MLSPTKAVIKTIQELQSATEDEIRKHSLKKYGVAGNTKEILDILLELGVVVKQDSRYIYTGSLSREATKPISTVITQREESEAKKRRGIIVDRNYDWDEYIPDKVVEYVPQGNELKKLEVCNRLRIEGPPGIGKTLMVEYYCYKNQIPLFTVQGFGAKISDLIGTIWLDGKTAYWVDGLLTKAILCSKERPCVLLVDEFNRMDPREQALFLSIADYRCQLTIPTTSEIIRGAEENLKIVLTMNVGSGFFVNRLDDAIRRRFACIEVDFLGLHNRDLEVEAVVKQSGVSRKVAEMMVDIANKIRKAAKSDSSTIDKGLPTHNVIQWAKLAKSYSQVGIEDPVLEAAKDVVISYYDDVARSEVEVIITSSLSSTKLKG